jgi:hypothetical protein
MVGYYFFYSTPTMSLYSLPWRLVKNRDAPVTKACGCLTNAQHRAAKQRRLKGMYTTTRNIAGGTLMECKDCGHAISMNKICEKPIHEATEMLKHMAAHNASNAFASVGIVMRPDPRSILAEVAALSPLPALLTGI